MKNLSRLILTVLLFTVIGSVNAQDKNNPWQITIGTNAVDPLGIDQKVGNEDISFSKLYNVAGEWSIGPTPSVVSIGKYLDDNFSFIVTGSSNKITKWNLSEEATTVEDLMYYGLDGMVKYSFSELLNSTKFEPYVGFGGGYTWMEQPENTGDAYESSTDLEGLATLNLTFGVSYWINDLVGITAQSGLKNSFDETVLVDHFQHSLGVTIKFGGNDSDGDGVYDKHDICPDVAGLAEFNGCPDSDGDGVQDSEDTCPNQAGLAEFNGCPDSDGDGVSDNNDTCPNEAGTKALSGCPDADADGVANTQDACPNEAGPVANNGCPWKDSDSDGVLDKDDNCPNEAGTVANNGCPEVVLPSKEQQAQLLSYSRTINFGLGESNFRRSTLPTLRAINAILTEYPKANFVVEGHTDSIGSEAFNQKLSEDRASKVVGFLTKNGVSSARLKSAGFGETSPIKSNSTGSGRAANRRVEVKLAK
jgi:outer membrane protein OmpA-like peptidoglycan-associated protein/outer membrane protein W